MSEELFAALVGGAAIGILIVMVTYIYRCGIIVKEKITDNKEQIFGLAKGAADKVVGTAATAYKSSSEAARKFSDNDSSIEEEYFEAAFNEFQSKKIRQSLWLKQLSLNNNNKEKAEANYIRVRARELRDSKI